MHQSFVVLAPMGPGNSGAFNFSVFKALLNALHCGDKFMVKSLLKAPAPPGGWQYWRTTNDLDHLIKLSSPIPWRSHIKFGFSWPSDFREDIWKHTHTHSLHTRTQQLRVVPDEKNMGGGVRGRALKAKHYVFARGGGGGWRGCFLAHLSRRLTRWAYRMGLEPASVRVCVRPSTLSNMNISETSRPITIKFYLKHHWGGGKAALCFGADQIRTLIATDSSHRVIMGKRASSRFLSCF